MIYTEDLREEVDRIIAIQRKTNILLGRIADLLEEAPWNTNKNSSPQQKKN